MTNAEHYKKEIEEFIKQDSIICKKCPACTPCVHESCLLHFTRWEREEYKPAIIRRTRQEWADFTRLYPEKDYFGQVYLYKEVPIKDAEMWLSSDDASGWNITDCCIPDNLPWDQLVEPRNIES